MPYETSGNGIYHAASDDRSRSLARGLHDAPGFSIRSLSLAVTGSVVVALFTRALGSNPTGALALAALTPVITTTFTTRGTVPAGRLRRAAIIILSVSALAISWPGLYVAGRAVDKTIVPGGTSVLVGEHKDNGSTPTPVTSGTPTGQLSLSFTPKAVDCGTGDVEQPTPCLSGVTITSTGSKKLHITTVEMTGQQAADFTADQNCVDTWLLTGESCETTVTFTPSEAGERSATLVIHQNLPRPDTGTAVPVSGTGTGGTTATPTAD